MKIKDYIESVRDQLTGYGVLESELPDSAYKKIINMALKELNRYYNATELLEITTEDNDGNKLSCINLKNFPEMNHIVKVYHTKAGSIGTSDDSRDDPVYMSQLQMFNFGNYNSSNLLYNIGAYSSAQRLVNALSTDLVWKEDKNGQKLYVNLPNGTYDSLTVEYIPELRDVSQIKGDYWTDILLRLSLAHAKVQLGRIRSRYTQSGALWTQDGETMLAEGTNELTALRDTLRSNSDTFFLVD